LLLSCPVFYLAPQWQQWFNYQAIEFPGSHGVSAILLVALYVYGGWIFTFQVKSDRRSRLGRTTLTVLAIALALAGNLLAMLDSSGTPWDWQLATIVPALFLGRWLEVLAIGEAHRVWEPFTQRVPSVARRLSPPDPQLEEVSVSDLQIGETICIRPGESIAIDGLVVAGESNVNQAFLTGKSDWMPKQPGDEVLAGAVNGEGELEVEVIRTHKYAVLSQILRLGQAAIATRSQDRVLAERAASWLTPIAIASSAFTFCFWLSSANWNFALNRAVTVLVVTCPPAFALAIPLAIANATGILSRAGILVGSWETCQQLKDIKIVAFNKTGTLSDGRFELRSIHSEGLSAPSALGIASALEVLSQHHLADAIVEEAQRQAVQELPATKFQAIAGYGVAGLVDGTFYRLGRPEWIAELGVKFPATLQESLWQSAALGESAIALMDDRQVLALFVLADRLRADACQTVRQLQAWGIQVAIISGDTKAAVQSVAEQLHIDRYYPGVSDLERAEIVRSLANESITAYIGDGIRDAAALKAASLGMAIGAGTQIAIESADLILMRDRPLDVVRAIQVGKAAFFKSRQNLWWALAYSCLAIAIAAGVTYPLGFLLSPAVGALCASFSLVAIAINAMRRSDRLLLSPPTPLPTRERGVI
jgi:Cu2+-exporting ATPase